jgi:hypothetical protein
MDETARILPPTKLIDTFEANGGFENNTNAFKATLWRATRAETGQVMALGARYLAMLWDSAWIAGGGEANGTALLTARNRDVVKGLYESTQFLPSLTIDEIAAVLGAGGSHPVSSPHTASHAGRTRSTRARPAGRSPASTRPPRRSAKTSASARKR